jgi:hypothetical protein
MGAEVGLETPFYGRPNFNYRSNGAFFLSPNFLFEGSYRLRLVYWGAFTMVRLTNVFTNGQTAVVGNR